MTENQEAVPAAVPAVPATAEAPAVPQVPPTDWPDDRAFGQFNVELQALCRMFRVNLEIDLLPRISKENGLMMIGSQLRLSRPPK